MFGKVKRWLGIEGVKVELILPDQVSSRSGVVEGTVRFYSMNTQMVKHLKLTLTEKYTRGRFKNKLADLYKIAEVELNDHIEVPADVPIDVDFRLPFTLVKSDMDELADKNLVLKKMVNTAKFLKNVKSEYMLEAEAEIEGTALNPFDKKEVNII
jgi:hypothetical protein